MKKNIIKITDFNSKELDIFARMQEPQLVHINEPQLGLFIAESPNVILRALEKGYEPECLLVEEGQIEKEASEIIKRVSEDIPIYTADLDVLVKITGFNLTRGILCAMRRKQMDDPVKLCQNAKNIAVLEGVVNPTNIGAIFRSAAALNIDVVLLTKDCADPLYRRASRVSMGTVFQVPWTYIGDSLEAWKENGMDILKGMGFTTLGMALTNDSIPISASVIRTYEKKAILLGSEGYGLSDRTMNKCDHTVIIPMSHNVDSLNVAAASAVAFWELCKSEA